MKLMLLILPLVSGCVGHRINLLEGGSIRLHEKVPADLSVQTDVFSDDGNLVVVGRMSRGPLDLTPIFGHIDIVVVSSSGEELSSVKADFRKLPTWRRGPHPLAFKAEFPGVPPEHSVIEITYHKEKHNE